MNFKINFRLLRKVKERENKCLCVLNQSCPCDGFLSKQKCGCMVYTKIKRRSRENFEVDNG